MQITTFYVVYFLWSRSPLGRWPIALCLVMIPLYIAGWLLSPHELRTHILHWFFYFQVMMMGVVVARYRLNEQKISRKWILTGLLISSLAYLFVKFMLSRRGLAVEYVSILHLLVLPVMYFFVMFSAEAQTVQWLARGGLLPQFATWLAGNTLEVYLVHYPVLENRHVLAAPAPLNLAAFWILTFALTWVVGKTRDSLLQRLEKTGPVKP